MSLIAYFVIKNGKDIQIRDRDEKIINGQSTEVFSNTLTDRALFKTLKGIEDFSGTNIDDGATHELKLVWRGDIKREQWINRTGKTVLFKILSAENCCEDDNTLILRVLERGEESIIVNQG